MTKSKKTISDLSILGGQPLFENKVYMGRPNIGDKKRILSEIEKILDSKWLTNDGPSVREFEKRVEAYIGVKHCVAMCNGTIALEIATRALELTGEVIVPSFTFVATAHALQWQEITPVFCDINKESHTISSKNIEKLVTPRTSGIVGVNVWGNPCNIEEIEKISKKHQLKLIFDSSHAFGCSYKGKMIGGFGDAEVFSFHATKFINTFEGGAVVTNNDKLAKKMRLMRNFGFDGLDNVVYIGTNGKMNEISAAMGISSLEYIDQFIDRNRENYNIYKKLLSTIPGVRMLSFDENESNNYQYIVLEIDEKITNISRDTLVEILHMENIMARRYFYPGCHSMEPYRSYYPNADVMLPRTKKIVTQVMILPTGNSVNQADIQKICDLIKFIVINSEEIRLKQK